MQIILPLYLLFVLFYVFASFFAILQVVRFSITPSLKIFLILLYLSGTAAALVISAVISS